MEYFQISSHPSPSENYVPCVFENLLADPLWCCFVFLAQMLFWFLCKILRSPNCGKYRKVLGGAITEVIIHRKCTNSTVVHYFRKHSRTTSGKLSTFVKTCFRVIYATINKYFLFISSTEALYIRGIVLKKEKVTNEQIPLILFRKI